MPPNATLAPHALLPWSPIPEEGRVGPWAGASRLFLWVPGAPSPAQGPSPRRGRGAGGRFLCSLPSAVLAAPEIKIKCGLGSGSGVGDAAASGGRRCCAFILSIVTSPPNLWHFNYSPTRLLSPGQRVSSPFPPAWDGGGRCRDPQPAPGKPDGGQAGAPTPPPPAAPCCSPTTPTPSPAVPGSQASSLAPRAPCVKHSVCTPTAPFHGGHCLKPKHRRPKARFVDDAAISVWTERGLGPEPVAPGPTLFPKPGRGQE